MATTRIISLHIGKGRTPAQALKDILDYNRNPDKTDNGTLVSAYQCNSRIAEAEFLFSKQQYANKTGRSRGSDNVIAYQIRQSFVPGEITPEEANRLGIELAKRFTKGNHAFVVCTHIDRKHIHNHIVWNSTSLDCTRKFRNFLGSGRAVRRLSDTICVENGYSIVENPKRRGKSYNKWLGSKPSSQRDKIRMAIDDALAQKPTDLDALLALLQGTGIEVSLRGQSIRLKPPGGKKFIRLDADSLGPEYSIPALLKVISGEKKHIPYAKNGYQAKPEKVDLLIDIQAKLQAGKGAGFERWAKRFNLKQMAQTLSYLSEHKLMDYAVLSQKAESSAARYHELSKQIKTMEKRMEELTSLRQHIINYSKTRNIYIAYRKAGYSKKFLAEHESDIILHKAAKAAFDSSGLKKLPTVKAINAEYTTLLSEKKSAYAAYREEQAEMKELLTVKSNVDQILGSQEK